MGLMKRLIVTGFFAGLLAFALFTLRDAAPLAVAAAPAHGIVLALAALPPPPDH